MGSQNKLQPYPYSLKTILAANQSACLNRFFLYMLPPKDALTIENLFCHFVFQFDAGVAAADRVVQSIGIVDQLTPFPITATSNYQRRQAVKVHGLLVSCVARPSSLFAIQIANTILGICRSKKIVVVRSIQRTS